MAIFTFSSQGPISVDDAVTSRVVKAYGIDSQILDVSIRIHGYTTTYVSDLDLLLVAPDQATNLLAFSDLRESDSATGIDLILTDSASEPLGASATGNVVVGGPYRPLNFNGSVEAAASFGLSGLTIRNATGGGTDFSVFKFLPAAGNWTFYIADDTSSDITNIQSLSLSLTTMINQVVLTGDANDQTYYIRETGETTGSFQQEGENPVTYADVIDFDIQGGAGQDTVDFSFSNREVLVDLSSENRWGGFFLSSIEHVIGSLADDTLIGSTGSDALSGSGGNDFFLGNGGGDRLTGGDGDRDVVSYEMSRSGVAVDLIFPSIVNTGDADFDTYSGIEDLIGTFHDDNLTGTDFANILIGRDGADVLMGRDGNDTLLGGDDNDSLVGGIGRDHFDGGEGMDLVYYNRSSFGVRASLTSAVLNFGEALGDSYISIEGLVGSIYADTLIGDSSHNLLQGGEWNDLLIAAGGHDSVWGGTDDDTLEGNNGNDSLLGEAGNDDLFGGTGDDTLDAGTGGVDELQGGLGNDVYRTDGSDNLSEIGGGGLDVVFSTANHVLGEGFENLTLTGNGNTNGTGNAAANRLAGNAGRNVLNGGSGNDILIGGAGNDTFQSDGGDIIVEATGQGTDLVISSAHVTTLWANVEQLELSGSQALNATGNGLANRISGNSAANMLIGGAGNDTLIGGAGSDTYITDSGDTVTETTGPGTDQINATHTVSVLATHVENLLLLGTGAFNGTGNGLANRIAGNGANNKIGGGLGLDTLTGGAGQDSFVFNTVLGAGNADKITDFKVIDDSIVLENAIFLGLATGGLAASAFAKNLTGAATDALDRIIYETDTGKLFFDADGTGASVRLQFATLATGLALTQADFTVI